MTDNPNWGVRVLLAEDSPTVRHFLTGLINETPGFHVVGAARDGEEALALTQELKPDVISMDIRMPRMDGLEATRRIMAQCPTPVVVVSGLLESEVELSMQALQAGALAVVEKPPDRRDPAFAEKQRQLMKTLLAMSGVKVIQRRELSSERITLLGGVGAPLLPVAATTPKPVTIDRPRLPPEVVAFGASAGGPSALINLLNGLTADFRLPIVVVQHMPGEFIGGLARWLRKSTPLAVNIVADNHLLQAGVVHLAPGGAHLTIVRQRQRLLARLVKAQGPHRYQPSVDVLFSSIAATCGSASVGVILTGMGDDGAEGLLAMRRAGARTFAQDESSATVFGMPGAAVERGSVEQVLPLSKLATAILNLV
ncbi:MAG: chemotaxis-specific protein-glutamate methyltransferase CheB [Chloroflexi bacterium]|nr:chemotaxis-specific protein-glutamate methyltransferase CheB [Chloroflexota bacterium]